jgi:hypothetical protein
MVPFRQTSWLGPGARRECNAELAGQSNFTADNNPGTAFGNVDERTVTLGKAPGITRVRASHIPKASVATLKFLAEFGTITDRTG